jgi:hypothetical protein
VLKFYPLLPCSTLLSGPVKLLLLFFIFTPLFMLKLYVHKWRLLLTIFSFFHSLIFAQVTEQWIARYNGPDGLFDGAHAIAVDGSGNLFVAGQSLGEQTLSDFIMVKYDANGNELWAKRYNSIYNLDDGATSIAVDLSGNVYAAGWSHISANATAFTTIKYDALGTQLWVKHYIGPGNFRNQVNALGIDASGNVFVTGVSTGLASNDDYATIKYNAAGNELWVKQYSGPDNSIDYPHSLAVGQSGNVYVTGVSNGDYLTIKYDKDGNMQWQRAYNGPGNSIDVAAKIVLNAIENVYITGESFGMGTGYDFATISYSSMGNELWVNRFNNPQNGMDQGRSLGVDAHGNVYVTGLSFSGAAQGSDYITLKYNSGGNEEWVKKYEGVVNGNDVPRALAVNAAGNVFVTGSSANAEGNMDYATVSYNTAGNELWVKRYGASQGSADAATAIAVDNTGNIYVTGISSTPAGHDDMATIKYGPQPCLQVRWPIHGHLTCFKKI